MKRFIDWLRSDERGQGMVEYALIIALVSVVAIVVLGVLGVDIKDIFTATETALDKTAGQ